MINRQNLSIFIVVLFHIIGYLGFTMDPLIPYFKRLVPFHLLLMLLLVLVNHQGWNRSFIRFTVFVTFSSFFLEVLGTNTGIPFGLYTYGSSLGFKLWNTPLLIAVNWFLLVYATGSIVHLMRIHSALLNSVLMAIILTMIDFMLEPMAIKFDYWSWDGQQIPVQNYIAWFFAGFIFSYAYQKSHFNKQNPAAMVLLPIQFIFFILLG